MDSKAATQPNFNILKPPTYWFGNRCYRVLSLASVSSHLANNERYLERDEYPDQTYEDEVSCIAEDDFSSFVTLSNGNIKTYFPVANAYFSYIVGSKGATKTRIENETFTQIKIPSRGQSGDVVIIGKDAKTVRQARIRIEALVEQAKKRQPFTHFVSVPFNSDLIQTNFLKFKEQVMDKCGTDRGVDPSLFQTPSKLHLTLCTLVLSDDRERQEAIKALERCREFLISEYLEGPSLKVEMKGIEYMNDDPSEVDVLYGKIYPHSWTHSLQEIVDAIADRLFKDGVAIKQHESVKLHVTLMNTLFRNDKDGTATKSEYWKAGERETFDARQILSKFKNFEFGQIEFSELHLSVRYSTNSKGYYSASTIVKLT